MFHYSFIFYSGCKSFILISLILYIYCFVPFSIDITIDSTTEVHLIVDGVADHKASIVG